MVFSRYAAYKTSVTNTLYRCNNNNWCCSAGGNTTSCCNDPGIDNVLFNVGQAQISNGSAWVSGLTLVPIAAVQTSLPTSSKSAQSFPTQTVFKNINNTDRTNGENQGDGHDDETKKVGLAVGFGVGVPLLIALSAAMILLWREKRSHQVTRQQLSSGFAQPVLPAQRFGWKNPVEMFARENDVPNEMLAENIPELQGERLRR